MPSALPTEESLTQSLRLTAWILPSNRLTVTAFPLSQILARSVRFFQQKAVLADFYYNGILQ